MPDTTINFPSTALQLKGTFTTTPFVYICDAGNNRIQAFDYVGNFLFTWGTFGSAAGQFSSPYGVATDGSRIYVTDSGNNRVQIFDPLGNLISQFGTLGSTPGAFNSPKGIATDGRFLYVADSGNNRLQVFTIYGALVLSVGTYGAGINQFNAPTNIRMDCFYVYVDDTGNNREVAYARNLNYDNVIYATVPMRTMAMSVSVGSIASLAASAPMRRSSFTATVPQLARLAATIPMRYMNASVVVGATVTIAGIVPMRTASFATRDNITMTLAATIPMRRASFSAVFKTTSLGLAIIANTVNHAITEYTSYSFESIGYVGDDIVGIGTDGYIYVLTGDNDNGVAINATIQTGDVDFADDKMRGRYKPKEAWVHYESEGPLTLSITGDQGNTYTYPVPVDNNVPTRKRVTFGKGLNSNVYSFTFQNIDGADFKIFDTEILADLITRRA